jgi:subtilisin family serine protease
MLSAISVLGKRWFALAAMVALMAVALTAGALFAANEREQPETQPLAQQSVADATDPGLAPDLPAAPPAPERVLVQPVDTEEEIDLPPIVKTPPKYPNLDSNLNRLAEEATSDQQTRSEDGGSGATAEPVLVTFYVTADHLDNVLQYLEDNDIFVRNVGEDYIEAHVPPGLLGIASEQPGVLRVDTVIPPRQLQSQTRVLSQGVGLHGADAWHRAGYQGNGVKVGVIDSGFEGFRQLQGSELPSNVTARCYFAGPRKPSSRIADCEVGSDHGTAVAETLVDVAPSVELYIANALSNGDLRNAVDWMAEQGVQVINYSLGKIVDGPGDGTSPFSDSPLRTIDAGVTQGIMWSVAGGNNAQQVWYGTFKDLDNDGAHHFTPRAEVNTFGVNQGDQLLAVMRWDDSWGNADCDLDLVLAAYTDRWVKLFADETIQDGSAGSYPLAAIIIEPATAAESGIYGLVIEKYDCATPPAWIQLIAWDSYLRHHSTSHHMANPGESRNPGMLAVGATHYWDTNSIAPYSSRGPTIDGRTKPDITGVACARSTIYSPETVDGRQCWFQGTSQSAPHVAGLAALVKQRFPGLGPEEVVAYLKQNATERGPSGADNTWGMVCPPCRLRNVLSPPLPLLLPLPLPPAPHRGRPVGRFRPPRTLPCAWATAPARW